MTAVGQTQVAPATVAHDLAFSDLRAALAAGFSDFMAHPFYGLFFSAFYALGGAALCYGLYYYGESLSLIPVVAGFPLLAPFAAVGLYEVSRRREEGLTMDWRSVLGALRGRGDEQLVLFSIILFVAFSFWMILAHGVFAIFLGESGIGAESALLLSPEAALMLIVGTLVGGVFAFGMFAITVTSLPMLVDRDVDFITAIIVSLGVMRSNKGTMRLWALLIAVLLFLAMLPVFLGLFLVLPMLGHASWHLYRRAVSHAA